MLDFWQSENSPYPGFLVAMTPHHGGGVAVFLLDCQGLSLLLDICWISPQMLDCQG